MRSAWRFVRACALVAAVAGTATAPSFAAEPALIPALQIDGKGFGHGVGMAQDGALAMGQAGASLKQILAQFYPGTSLGKSGGQVRVPVYAGNNVEVAFPDGGEVRGNGESLRFAAGTSALVAREASGYRVKPIAAPSSTTTSTSSAPSTTSSSTTTISTTTTTEPTPLGVRKRESKLGPINAPTTTTPAPTTSTTLPPSPGVVFSGVATLVPTDGGRIGITPRGRRYRGVVEITPLGGGVRFVNQLPVETYLRGMGEVRNPNWPAASLQAQAVAARTYALRAMAAGGELCDTQRCQVYIGSDAEYAAMDRAVAATAGEVLTYGRGLASAVYSANGGGHSATPTEGFGQVNPASYPYLRAAPYLCTNANPWSLTVALTDVAHRLKYGGTLTGVEVAERGPSGRAIQLVLHGDHGDKSVTGLAFDAALGLKSTLFSLRVTQATKVASIKGGSVLQAPPEQAAGAVAAPKAALYPEATVARAVQPVAHARRGAIGTPAVVALMMWGGVIVAAITMRRRGRRAWRAYLS